MMHERTGDRSTAVATGTRVGVLDGIRRRFSRRWKIGIAIGTLLVGFNWLGYRMMSNDVLERLAGDPEAVASVRRMAEVNAFLAFVALAVLAALALLFFRPLDRTLAEEATWIREVEAAQSYDLETRRFEHELHEALEMATDEGGVTSVVRHVLAEVAPDRPAEVKLADASDSHLTVRTESPTAGRAGCGVAAPFDCPAVRRARPLSFSTSSSINACPHLRGRDCSANCVPLSFMGRSMGVLHVVGPDGEPLDGIELDKMVALAAQTSAQLGTLRAFAKAQLQASTDGLTGLINRRTAEEELARWLERDEVFALAVVDLDHFKRLNDAHGHQAGDRALRLFADTVRRTLRSRDLFARWGGEEFVVALAGMDRWSAVDTFDRVRLALVEACARAEAPTVTASFGVVDTSCADSLDGIVRLADDALLTAKRSGRDRVVVGPVVDDARSNDVRPNGASSNGATRGKQREPDDVTVAQPSNTTVLRP